MTSLEDFLRPTQKQLFKRLCKKFKGKTFISKGNFILVHGLAPVMLVAHLDTVHEQPARDICISADRNILMSPQGIGGDDRCGVFALCNIFLSASVKPWLLFTCDEEIGGLGAKNFCLAHQQNQIPKEIDQLKCIIELDRKGKNDAIFYNCDNPDFEEYISSKGFKSAQGSFSDISVIAPQLGIAAVNLSCGYYHPHTRHEYINRFHLDSTIKKVCDILSDSLVSDFPSFSFIPKIHPCHNFHRNLCSENLSKKIPYDLSLIYNELLDFYSPDELDSLLDTYGYDSLIQLYCQEFQYSSSDLKHLFYYSH